MSPWSQLDWFSCVTLIKIWLNAVSQLSRSCTTRSTRTRVADWATRSWRRGCDVSAPTSPRRRSRRRQPRWASRRVGGQLFQPHTKTKSLWSRSDKGNTKCWLQISLDWNRAWRSRDRCNKRGDLVQDRMPRTQRRWLLYFQTVGLVTMWCRVDH